MTKNVEFITAFIRIAQEIATNWFIKIQIIADIKYTPEPENLQKYIDVATLYQITY